MHEVHDLPAQKRARTHGLVSLLLVLVVLLEEQRPSDADLSPGRPAIGIIPAQATATNVSLFYNNIAIGLFVKCLIRHVVFILTLLAVVMLVVVVLVCM